MRTNNEFYRSGWYHLNGLLRLLGILCLIYSSFVTAQESDPWGLVPGSPAVVNSVTVAPQQKILSLRGEWDFATDNQLLGRHRMGKGPGWNEPDWSNVRKINLPGCWEAQGVGEPGLSQTWDCLFDRCERPLDHIYMGTARYRKEVQIPDDWKGQEIWLKVGGVRSEAWFWVNKQRVAHVNNYCGTYKFNISDYVQPGEMAEIVATVRNDSPSRKGEMSCFHKFGGFYRDIELEATPSLWIDDVWVASDFENRAADVHVTLAQKADTVPPSLKNPMVRVWIKTPDGQTVASEQHNVSCSSAEEEFIWKIPIPDCRLWSPENPNLYLAEIQLVDADGQAAHGWTERFGIRKLEVIGNRFYLNGKPYFFRGYGDDSVYPETIVSPPDKAYHLKNMKVLKEAGFNYVRLHTHCEIPEFFEAADEAGILVQPELPYYHDITVEAFPFDPLRDVQELYRHYRRYVSFATYSMGNEGHLGTPLDQEIYQWIKQNDPARLVLHQDGGCNYPKNADFDSPNGYWNGPTSIFPWSPGAFDFIDTPFVAHEYLNLSVKMDPRLENRFTGAILPPRTMADYEKSLERVGLTRMFGDACLNAAHGLQGIYQKQGLEQARLDPACDGYSYWTALDVMIPQGPTYTAQGFLNAFYEPKPGGLTPSEFSEFNAPTVLLALMDPTQKILVAGQKMTVDFRVSHFSFEDLPEGKLVWTIQAGNEILTEGAFPIGPLQTGDVRSLNVITITVPQVDKPTQAKLTANIDGTGFSNHWNIWIFPPRTKMDLTGYAVSPGLYDTIKLYYDNVVLYEPSRTALSDAVILDYQETELLTSAIQEGRSVLAINPTNGQPNVQLGWWNLGSQLGTTFRYVFDEKTNENEAVFDSGLLKKHPVFGDFPMNQSVDELWFELIKGGMYDLREKFPLGEIEPLAVGEGLDTYYMYLGQTEVGKAHLLVSFGIELLQDRPESLALLDNLIRYITTDEFHGGNPH